MNPSSIPTDPEIRNRLTEMTKRDAFEAAVAHELLEYEDIPGYLDDLTRYGFMHTTPAFIDLGDGHAVFDCYDFEINELCTEWQKAGGAPLIVRGDIKDFFAWFAFEVVAARIARELGLPFDLTGS